MSSKRQTVFSPKLKSNQPKATAEQVMQHFDGLNVSVLTPKGPSKEKIRSQESF